MVRFCFIVALLLVSSPAKASESEYVVISLVSERDPYFKAAQRLTEIRSAKLILATVKDVDSLLPQLKQVAPQNVAIVVRPDQFDQNLAHRVLKMSTRIDDDPFIDFCYGFITGRTPESAVRFAQAGVATERERRKPSTLVYAGTGGGRSHSRTQTLALKGMPLNYEQYYVASPQHGDHQRDAKFIENMLSKLEGHPLIGLGGHGYPHTIVGGPTWEDVKGRNYTGAVAFNIACYTGVTSRWYDMTGESRRLIEKCVEPDQSFCLQMIDTGVAAYVAYSCARPAGPEMSADMVSVATLGISIGEQRRRQGNSVILTHLAQGFDEVVAEQIENGQPQKRTSVDELVRGWSAGGVLFGDPAFVPFEETPGAHPVETDVTREVGQLTAVVRVNGRYWQWHCSDQLEQPQLRLEARIPLGTDHVRSIRMTKLPFGDQRQPLRVSGAIEEHNGSRILNVKALFERFDGAQREFPKGIAATLVVETTDNPDQAQRRFSTAKKRATVEAEEVRKSELERIVLDNGITVVLNPIPDASKIGMRVSYDVGFLHEPAHLTHAAKLVGYMTRRIGAPSSFSDATYFDAIFLPTVLEMQLKHEAQRLNGLPIEPALFRQRASYLQERAQGADDQFSGSINHSGALLNQAWRHERKSDLTIDRLLELPLDDLRKFYKRHYRPENLRITLSGGFKRDEALSLIKEHLSEVSSSDPLAREPIDWSSVAKRSTIRRSSKAHSICIAFPPPTRHLDRVAMTAFGVFVWEALWEELWGGIAEDAELKKLIVPSSVAVTSSYNWPVGDMPFFIYATAQEGADLKEAERLLTNRLQRIANDPANLHPAALAHVTSSAYWRVAQFDLDKAVQDQVRLHEISGIKVDAEVHERDVLRDQARNMGAMDRWLGPNPEETIDALSRLTRQQLQQMVKETIHPDRQIITYLVPK